MEYTLGFPYLLLLTSVFGLFIAKLSSLTYIPACLYTFCVVIPSYYVVYECYIYPFYISSLRFVPTVPGFPLWAQLLPVFTEEFGVPQRRWHKQHGRIIRYHILGRPRLSVIDDDALTQITVRNPYVWEKPPSERRLLTEMLGKGVLLAEGNVHVQQRKALAPAFSISSIKALLPVFWGKGLLLSKLWQAEFKEDAETLSIEILDWLNRTTLDIIGEAGLGTNFDSLNHPETPILKAYQLYFNFDGWAQFYHGLQTQTPLAKYLPVKEKRDITAASRIIRGIASQIVQVKQSEKLSKPLSRAKDIISLVVRDNSTASGKLDGQMSFETMRDQVMTFIGAGHETTSAAVAWTLHLLAKHPATQEKLRREIHAYYPFLFTPAARHDESRLSTIDEDRLPYLNNVCRESLRYIPPVPLVLRENTADDVLGGYRVPAGTLVVIYSNTINRAPHFWGDEAHLFDPDRWDRLPDTYTPNAYMPFLHGPRGCIARKFAETEMKTLLCCLLSMYRFDVDGAVENPENLKMWRISHRPKDGITLKVTRLAQTSSGEVIH